MKKSILCILLISILLLNFTVVFAVQGITIELSKTRVKTGDSLSVSGIAEANEWVSIKIIDADGNIVYFNAAKSDLTGVYKDTFKVPSINYGKLTIIAGSGGNTTTAELEVYKPSEGGSSDDSCKPRPEVKKKDDGSVAILLPKPDVDEETGQAKVVVPSEDIETAFKEVKNEKGKKRIQIEIPRPKEGNGYQIELPKAALESNKEREMEIKTEIGTITLPGNMLDNIKTGSTKNISLTMKMADETQLKEKLEKLKEKSKLTDKQINEIVKFKSVIELELIEDGQRVEWKNRKAPVTITLPYTPTEKEKKNPDKIAVWYIDGEGNFVRVRSGRYNAETGMVEFTVKHFSTYAVVYDDITFDDLEPYPWAKYEIEVLAAKGIANGTGNNKFTPGANISRADFLTLLVRTLELEADVINNFDDVKETDYYYEEVGIAKALGITTGNGQNQFNPKAYITRQDMMTLTYRALASLDMLNDEIDLTILDQYNDTHLASDYALNSISILVKNGLIKGSNSKINPLGYTTRAEAAVFLYRIYNKII